MRVNKDFSIAFKGLKPGVHYFQFEIGNQFFQNFETSPVKTGNIDVELSFLKSMDHFELDFDIYGTVGSICDRCTSEIDLPIENQGKYIVKFSDDEVSDDEILFIPLNTQILDLTNMIYELVILSLPLIKVFDCEELDPSPCNDSVLDYLSNREDTPETKNQDNPIWDKLNEIKFEDN